MTWISIHTAAKPSPPRRNIPAPEHLLPSTGGGQQASALTLLTAQTLAVLASDQLLFPEGR